MLGFEAISEKEKLIYILDSKKLMEKIGLK